MSNEWVCDLCFPESKEIGMIGPGLALLHHDNKYYLCWGQGHNGDEIFYCEETPTIDPDPECECEGLTEYEDKWMERADAAFERLNMAPDSGHSFVETCKVGGFSHESPHRMLVYWLYNRCGELVTATTGNGDAICDVQNITDQIATVYSRLK